MALEPRTPALEGENPELADMTRRFWIAVTLTAPLLVMTMAEMFGVSLGARAFIWLNPMIASAAMSLSSVSVIANALRLRRLQ